MSKKLLSTKDTDRLKKWLVKEFNAKELPYKKNEYQFNCPWCDKGENHYDYTFNVKKQKGHCWRSFSEWCESGHSLLVFVSFYYNISFKKAKALIKSKFESEDSLYRVKNKLRNVEVDRKISIKSNRIVWDIPRGTESVLRSDSLGAKRALTWLRKIRNIPDEAIRLIDPRYVGDKVDSRWERHRGRIFFPVHTMEHRAWLSYSMKKKHSKKYPKTLNPPGQILSNMFYLYNFYIESEEPLILCEGIFDALRLFLFGFNAMAIFGTNVSDSQVDLLNLLPAKEVVVCLDADATAPKFDDRTGKYKSSKAFKVAKVLREFYFGTTSIMKLKSGDPDELTYMRAYKLFRNREGFNTLAASLRRLKTRCT